MPFFRTIGALWLSFVLCSFSQVAHAADWGTVDALWAARPDGSWAEARELAEARRRPEGIAAGAEGDALVLGMVLQSGDTLEVRNDARVRVRRPGGELVIISPNTTLQLDDRGVFEQIGEALYHVRDTFRVKYRRVEAAVEGTRFLVRTSGDQWTVQVLEGWVRVTGPGGSTLVPAGQQASGLASAGPAPDTQPVQSGPKLAKLAQALGSQRFMVAGLVGARQGGPGEGPLDARVLARARISPGWNAVLEAGLATDGQRFHLPGAIGFERRLGPLGLGASGMVAVGQEVDCAGTVAPGVAIGGGATARLSSPLVGALRLEQTARVGWLGGLHTDFAAGVGVGW